MKVTETPLQVHPLTAMREITGGNKGYLFLLKNGLQEKLVVKFQMEEPVKPILGTHVLKRVNVTTPDLREATGQERGQLLTAVEQLGNEKLAKRYRKRNGSFKYCLLMDYVKGQTIKQVREGELKIFLQVICDKDFQVELGRIIGADTFAGNPDRMYALMDQGQVKGWYHEKNLFIRQGRPVAIDNSFDPDLAFFDHPWGFWGWGVQFGSMASAQIGLARIEAGAIFDKLLSTAASDHGSELDLIEEARQHKEEFVTQVATSATETLKLLLTRGGGWKQQIQGSGGEKILDEFKVRKRVFRLMTLGMAWEEAQKMAKDENAYRSFILINEYSLPAQEAEDLMKKGLQEYKLFKRSRM